MNRIKDQARSSPAVRSKTPSKGAELRSSSCRPRASSVEPHEDVQELLHNIVRLAANCSKKLQSSAVVSPAPSLNRDEVERIVRRVEMHFVKTIEDLKAENDSLRRQLSERRSQGDVEILRQQLYEEKRQRLACEEQSQRMSEEHSKVVSTLEQRMRKQEKLLAEMGRPSATPRSARVVTPHRDDERKKVSDDACTSVVSDFLSSIGKELDEISAVEAARSAQLRALV